MTKESAMDNHIKKALKEQGFGIRLLCHIPFIKKFYIKKIKDYLEIVDRKYFYKELARALQVPKEYLTRGDKVLNILDQNILNLENMSTEELLELEKANNIEEVLNKNDEDYINKECEIEIPSIETSSIDDLDFYIV